MQRHDRPIRRRAFLGPLAGLALLSVAPGAIAVEKLKVGDTIVSYWPSDQAPGLVEYQMDQKGYKNTYTLDCQKGQFRWTSNVSLSTGQETGNNNGADWKPIGPKSLASKAVYEAACRNANAQADKPQSPAHDDQSPTGPAPKPETVPVAQPGPAGAPTSPGHPSNKVILKGPNGEPIPDDVREAFEFLERAFTDKKGSKYLSVLDDTVCHLRCSDSNIPGYSIDFVLSDVALDSIELNETYGIRYIQFETKDAKPRFRYHYSDQSDLGASAACFPSDVPKGAVKNFYSLAEFCGAK